MPAFENFEPKNTKIPPRSTQKTNVPQLSSKNVIIMILIKSNLEKIPRR